MSRRLTNAIRLAVWSVLLFVATLWLFTRHADFPSYYHPDEPGKVEQMLGKRALNFHHPLLMLNTARLFAGWAHNGQEAVEIGRTISAVFTAVAVVALSLMGYAWRGWIMMGAVGLGLMLHHQLFELAHYFKEDTALLCGVAVTFIALHVFDHRPGVRTAVFVGAGAGLALAGKVAGALVLVVVIPVLLSRRAGTIPVHDDFPPPSTPRRSRRSGGILLLAMFGAMAVTFLLINPQFVTNWSAVWASLSRESRLVTGGQELTQKVPHAKYWNVFLANTTPVMWVLILVALWGAWNRRRQLRVAEWATLIFPFLVAVVLSFLPKDNDRYFLPATALFVVVAAFGAGEVRHLLPPALRQRELASEAIAAALMLLAQFPGWTEDRGGLLRYWAAFQHDDNAELAEWLRKNLPPNSVVAKDEKVRLPTLPFKILSEDYIADLTPTGTVEELAKVARYAVITDNTFGKFERRDYQPKGDEGAKYERRKLFYATLRGESVPIRDWRRGTVIYLHPGLEVYRLDVQ